MRPELILGRGKEAIASRLRLLRRDSPVGGGQAAAEQADHGHRRLLRTRRKRPRGCAAEKRDEIAPPHGAYPKAKIKN
jgi:hypothetical protein